MIAAPTETSVLTKANGGELTDTVVPMAIPAAIAIGAAEIGTANRSSATV